MTPYTTRLTKAFIRLDHLVHNMKLLQAEVGGCQLWPCIKANAYGHGAEVVARRLREIGYGTFGVADVGEAVALQEAGIEARFVVFSAGLPEQAEALVAYGCEPTVCTLEMLAALNNAARGRNQVVDVHLKVDTGMERIGIRPVEVPAFLEHARSLDGVRVKGLMSHFPRADEADKSFSLAQIERFKAVVEQGRAYGVAVNHMANSAAILDLPTSHMDAARPGIAMYGLAPSAQIVNPAVAKLRPVLEWKTRITFLKEVPAGTGLSYGHAYHTDRPSLVATLPVGYGDGLHRNLSNSIDVLIRGVRCPQVGRITMDMTLVDVTALRGRVALGAEVVLIGRQGDESISADELAGKLGSINYEIVTCIAQRVPRVVCGV